MKVRVLVVDDSALTRRMVAEVLEKDPEIEVVGAAADAYEAREKIVSLRPDVLTLDLEMPKMDGLTFLKALMEHQPMPVVVLSSFTKGGSQHALQALQLGAVDALGKPGDPAALAEMAPQLARAVRDAALVHVENLLPHPDRPRIAAPAAEPAAFDPRQVVLLGASTGGTEALREILTRLPRRMPGLCVVQHIPGGFSRSFAERLNGLCDLDVREAADGDWVEPGVALLAPGGWHMELRREEERHRVRLTQADPVWYQRPAVDVLFHSAAACGAAPHAVAALLTGMGRDGADGLLALRKAGARTFAQDEASCVVFGMPKAALDLGAAEEAVSLDAFPARLFEAVHRSSPLS
ncbi:MAG: chemotaxis response regulator protein-glutamate methylesterase [Verrucomicrobium sp.]|nr:chemotaxis response regulator protein-glutamate methylesterase [Verrucomicrobium sp.]